MKVVAARESLVLLALKGTARGALHAYEASSGRGGGAMWERFTIAPLPTSRPSAARLASGLGGLPTRTRAEER